MCYYTPVPIYSHLGLIITTNILLKEFLATIKTTSSLNYQIECCITNELKQLALFDLFIKKTLK